MLSIDHVRCCFILLCLMSVVYIKSLWFSLKTDSITKLVTLPLATVLKIKQKELTFVLAYPRSFIITQMLIQYDPLR